MQCQVCAGNIPLNLSRISARPSDEILQGRVYATIDPAYSTYPWPEYWTVSVTPKHGATIYLKFDNTDMERLRQQGLVPVKGQQIRCRARHVHLVETGRPVAFEIEEFVILSPQR